MKLFKFLLPYFFLNALYPQDCIKGDCQNGAGALKGESFSYKGDFKDGRMHGSGEYAWPNGLTYVGKFREDFFEGYGKMTYPNGFIYEGDFKYDKRHGKGKFSSSEGEHYSGDWLFGKKHGYGSYTNGKGYSHEGNYLFGEPNGFGKQKWSDGSQYEGNFKNGYRDGYGIYTWESGETYEGDWKDGKKHGVGISKKNGEVILTGIWYNGEHKSNMEGCLKNNQKCLPNRICCKIKHENSEIYYHDSKKILVSANQLPSFLAVYPNAEKRIYYNANWELASPENSKYYRIYSDIDTIQKTYTINSYYTSNHQLQWSGKVQNNDPEATNCQDAVCEGKSTWYTEEGQISSQSTHLEGRQHGKSIIYLNDGAKMELNYNRGKFLSNK